MSQESESKESSSSRNGGVFSVQRMLIFVAAVPLLALLGWVVYLNLPRTQHGVSEIDFNAKNTPSENADSSDEPATDGVSEAAPPAARDLPFNVNVVYTPGYLVDLGGLERLHPFDIRKYAKIVDGLKQDKLITDEQIFKPDSISREDLLLVHTEDYLQSLQNRSKLAEYLEGPALVFAPVSLDAALLEPLRLGTGGTLLASKLALQTGIGINLAGGYHHAKPHKGEGFCIYNDIPIVIRRLQKDKLIKRAVVVDVDVHQGNGTIVCLKDDDSTFTFSMHQGNIYPQPKEVGDLDVELAAGTKDDEYMALLNKHLPAVLDEADADICIIVGGCDTLAADPLASVEMTIDGIVARDAAIVKACVDRKLPVVFTLSGGYSKEAWKAQYLSVRNLIETYQLSELTAADNVAPKK